MTILKRSCVVMIMNALTRVTFAAGCAIALTVPATQAQVIDTQGQLRIAAPRPKAGEHVQWIPGDNHMDSAQYEHLLRTSPAFRQSRIQKECGSLTIAHLRAGCIDSFSVYEDQRSVDWSEGLTGGGTGIMNSTGATPYNPNTYDAGSGR